MSTIPIHGTVGPGFQSVRDVFERTLAKGEVGAAVSAYLDGQPVVDLWGGWADGHKTREWQRDTIVNTYSTTKGMTATCAHKLIDEGLLDVDERVARYWPEFANAGKDEITVRMLLSHQAGLATRPNVKDGKRYDWDTNIAALENQSPSSKPGARSEYHELTFGYLVGNLVKRIDGRTPGTYFREEIAQPLGSDFMIGFGPEHDSRCADLVGHPDFVNQRAWRAAEVPALNGHGSAHGLARVYAALVGGGELDGVRIMRAETIDASIVEQLPAEGPDTEKFGLGYQLLWKHFPGLANTRAFGHFGTGGSIGLADPTNGLAIGYVRNQMEGGGAASDLLTAIYIAVLTQRSSSRPAPRPDNSKGGA